MKMGKRLTISFGAVLLILLSSTITSEAFDSSDKLPPQLSALDAIIRPSTDNGGKILLSLVTTDDKNLVETPRMELTYAFQWKLGENPPPKCTSSNTFKLVLSVEESQSKRLISNASVKQTFYAFGALPKIPSLDPSCREYRDFNQPPAVSLNSAISSSKVDGKSPIPVFSGKIIPPQIRDLSGRVSGSASFSPTLASKDLWRIPWPEKLVAPCLTSSSYLQFQKSLTVLSSYDTEVERARQVGSQENLDATKQIEELRGDIEKYSAFLSDEGEKPWERLSWCELSKNSTVLLKQIRDWTSEQKKITDAFEKQNLNEAKQREVQLAKELANRRAGLLSEVTSKVKEKEALIEKFGADYRKLTNTPLEIRKGTSLGATEKSKKNASQIAQSRLNLVKVDLDREWKQVIEIDNFLYSVTSEQSSYSDKTSLAFYKSYLQSIVKLRTSSEKLISILLQYTQFYLLEIEKLKRMG